MFYVGLMECMYIMQYHLNIMKYSMYTMQKIVYIMHYTLNTM